MENITYRCFSQTVSPVKKSQAGSTRWRRTCPVNPPLTPMPLT